MSLKAAPPPHEAFLMTPALHRAAAHQLRQQGQHELAEQHENLAKGIETRTAINS